MTESEQERKERLLQKFLGRLMKINPKYDEDRLEYEKGYRYKAYVPGYYLNTISFKSKKEAKEFYLDAVKERPVSVENEKRDDDLSSPALTKKIKKS